MSTEDESPDDWSPYDLAQQVVDGQKRTEQAHLDIATELTKVEEKIHDWIVSIDASDAWSEDTSYGADEYHLWVADMIRTGTWRKP